jgi:hypothetical protein
MMTFKRHGSGSRTKACDYLRRGRKQAVRLRLRLE